MPENSSQANPDDKRTVRIQRRRFLAWSAVWVAAISTPLRACSKLIHDAMAPETPSAPRTTPASATFARYPIPAYIPRGYTFLGEDLDRPDGFTPNAEQSALLYRGPASREYDLAFPIMVIVSSFVGGRFGGTEGREGVLYPIAFSDGTTTDAMYFDGIWELPRVSAEVARTSERLPLWNRDNIHALVFQWHGLQVGVRAARQCGVSFDELVKVASSLAV